MSPLGLGLGLSAAKGSKASFYITDIFNGFNRVSGDSFVGGPTIVPDNSGVLQTSPANTTMAVQGARFSAGTWLPTAANGSQLWTSEQIKARKVNTAKYASTFLGFRNEPQSTNIFLNSETPATQGVTTTAQPYTISLVGSGSITVSGTASGVATAAAPLTVTCSAGTLTCTVSGTVTHGQVEAGAFSTSPIVTTAATANRLATNYFRPTSGVFRPNNWGVWGRVIPEAAAQPNPFAFGIYTDASNSIGVYANDSTHLSYSKKIAAVNNLATVAYTHTAGVAFEYQAFQSSVYGMGIRVKQDGGAWSAWATLSNAAGLSDAPIASTYQVGAKNNNSPFAGNLPFILVLQHMDPQGQLVSLATKYP